MDAYILKFHSRKLQMVVLALFCVCSSFGQQLNIMQEPCKRDTLLYCWHDAMADEYPDMIPEDCYMELHIADGNLEKGLFWGTTDEFDNGREGYPCGFFVLPMTEIQYDGDSVLFKLCLIKTEHGEDVNCFVKAPIDRHIRSWQEALYRYQAWDYITGNITGYSTAEAKFCIIFNQKHKTIAPHSFPVEDSITLRKLTIAPGEERTFVLQKKKHR